MYVVTQSNRDGIVLYASVTDNREHNIPCWTGIKAEAVKFSKERAEEELAKRLRYGYHLRGYKLEVRSY